MNAIIRMTTTPTMMYHVIEHLLNDLHLVYSKEDSPVTRVCPP